MPRPESPAGDRGVDDVLADLRGVGYLADRAAATVVHLSGVLQKPVLIEGPAGTGKTALAKSVADATGRPLIRLQCYEGLDESKAIYEWDYRRQLLQLQLQQGGTADLAESGIFGEEFLLSRPLLAAIRSAEPVVLLIDEVDRLDIESEALLLEVLSEFQVSVPELGTVTARHIPQVFLTSNNTRDLSEALKRRCLYLHLGHPCTWPRRSPSWWPRCGARTCASRRLSRSPSTGPGRSSPWARPSSPTTSHGRRSRFC
jgi:MoxR-like ATPase